MDPICPRCHTPLGTQARFCLECGAPQLTVEPAAPENSSGGDAGDLPDRDSGGIPQIAWPAAIGTAALLSVPVGLLSSLLSFSTLWVIAGGVWTIAIYRRRIAARPGTPPGVGSGTVAGINASLGSRIGCVFGIFAAIVATLTDALSLLLTRYGLHRGADIDSRLHLAMQSGIDRVLASNPDAARDIPWFFHFWLSPYGQAGLVLASAVLSAGSMLGFSALGGALGARWSGNRPAWSK